MYIIDVYMYSQNTFFIVNVKYRIVTPTFFSFNTVIKKIISRCPIVKISNYFKIKVKIFNIHARK